MGKSTSGPDWMDVMGYLSALDTLHECRTGILLTHRGTGHNGSMHISIISTWDAVPGSAQIAEVVSESEYPCGNCTSVAQHVYSGCYRHDFAIGEAYQQRSFKEA